MFGKEKDGQGKILQPFFGYPPSTNTGSCILPSFLTSSRKNIMGDSQADICVDMTPPSVVYIFLVAWDHKKAGKHFFSVFPILNSSLFNFNKLYKTYNIVTESVTNKIKIYIEKCVHHIYNFTNCNRKCYSNTQKIKKKVLHKIKAKGINSKGGILNVLQTL